MSETPIKSCRWLQRYLIWTLLVLLLMQFLPCAASAAENVASPLEILVFSGRSCGSCATIDEALEQRGAAYRSVNVDELPGYTLLAREEQRLGREASKLPVLIYGQTMICGRDEILQEIKEITARQRSATEKASLSATAQSAIPSQTTTDFPERLKRLGVLTIALAGLADGVNPCAFATIAFLVGCLLGSGRQKALVTGLGFAAGVFTAYFLAGLGVFKLLFALREFTLVQQCFHLIVQLLLAGFMALALLDAFWLYRKEGKPLLRMPEGIRLRANALIARRVRNGGFILGGFVLGCLISLLELACTGQLYLPTILYLIESGTGGAEAYLYLLLYNLMFILPLLVVLILCLRGLAVKALWNLLKKRAWLSRLLLALILGMMLVALYIK